MSRNISLYFTGWYVVWPVVVASTLANAGNQWVVEQLGFGQSVPAEILAGTIIGSLAGVVTWLAMVLTMSRFRLTPD